MKSAYGRQMPAPDYELTSVEPGSPMGELMRRYWQPVCTSDELRDLPRKEKIGADRAASASNRPSPALPRRGWREASPAGSTARFAASVKLSDRFRRISPVVTCIVK